MKKNLLLTILCILAGTLLSFAQITASDYVTTWNTSFGTSGASAADQITIPASGEYTIFYESIPAGISGSLPVAGTLTGTQTITLPSAGIYRVAIKPVGTTPFHRISFNAIGDAIKLLTIEQWGSAAWSSFENAYWGCMSLTSITATDVPDLTHVASMEQAFRDCRTLTTVSKLNNWDVSAVTNMKGMFFATEGFNEPVGNWNVSAVTNMQSMFMYAFAFNQPLDSWNVTAVKNMVSMFNGAFAFNQSLSSWNVSAVTSMASMFANARAFNQPIGNWNVSSVTDMRGMFSRSFAFNQPIGSWNVSSVTNMGGMFSSAKAFNQPIGNWDVSAVTDMNNMFSGAQVFSQPIGSWDVSAVTNMIGMFANTGAFNQQIANWNVSAVKYMRAMFTGSQAFNQPLESWNVSAVIEMSYMFDGAKGFNQPIGKWAFNTSVDMANMLNNSGIDCRNYSVTLIDLANNPATPMNRNFGAGSMIYGNDAIAARDSLTTYRGWTIQGDSLDVNCAVLPVKLISFSATAVSDRTVEVNWTTAQETQNERFVVERSKDLTGFEIVAEIRDVAGNSQSKNSYRISDFSPYLGTSYYRLLQYDIDGSRTESRVVSVIVRSQDYSLYPNPVQSRSFRISVDEPVTAQVRIDNAAGSAIAFKRRVEGPQTIVITPAGQLTPGTYLITIQERAATRTLNLIVQ